MRATWMCIAGAIPSCCSGHARAVRGRSVSCSRQLTVLNSKTECLLHTWFWCLGGYEILGRHSVARMATSYRGGVKFDLAGGLA